MGVPYVCEGTIVKTINGCSGRVITVNPERKIAIIRDGQVSFLEEIKSLKVISYREVQ